VGAYLRSDAPVDPDTPVATSNLQAYRRVGRTDQQFDFMLLRAQSPTDADVVMRRGSGATRGASLPKEWAFVYSNNGPGWAYSVEFDAYHPEHTVTAGPRGLDLPPPDQEDPRYARSPRTSAVRAQAEGENPSGEAVQLTAVYVDSASLRWRSVVALTPSADNYVPGRRTRRIAEFPSKRALAGDV